MTPPAERACRYCQDQPAIVATLVRVGPPPGREVTLYIDVDPHPAGDIVQLEDGSWRQLGPLDARNRPTHRCHGATICGPGSKAKRNRTGAEHRLRQRR